MSKKVVVLDTNVLLHDPEAPSSFGSDRIVLPIQVVEEIDRFKRDPSEKGRNSRRVARLLDGLRQRGNLADGVPLIPGGEGTLEVAFCRSETLAQLPPELQGGVVTTTSWLSLSNRCVRKVLLIPLRWC